MTQPRKTPIRKPKALALVEQDGVLTPDYQWHTYRFLLSTGETVDVRAIHDTSALREAVLAWRKGGNDLRIEGVADVTEAT